MDSDDIDSVWEKEITDRVRAVDGGTAIGIDYDKAMQIERTAMNPRVKQVTPNPDYTLNILYKKQRV